MGKAEEAAGKRRSKAIKKRLRRAGFASGGVNAIIAAKRRRKNGKRRICEGMCYSLPTPDDPFNDRSEGRRKKKMSRCDNSETESNDRSQGKKKNNNLHGEDDVLEDNDISEGTEPSEDEARRISVPRDQKLASRMADASNGAQIAYKVIVEALSRERNAATGEKEKRILSSTKFDRDVWEACEKGLDVIGTIDGSLIPSLAYVPAAVNHIVKQPSKTMLHGKPMALFIVGSQEDALNVRRICKPLKELLGIQAISIHPSTPIEHQVEGLKSSSPEILVATPERLCELLSRKAINLLNVSFLVVENLEALLAKGFKANMHTIKSHTSPTMQSVILSERFSEVAISIARQFVEDPVTRVMAGKLLKDQGACISQDVSVVIDDAKRFPKLLNVIRQSYVDDSLPRTLVLVRKNEDMELLSSGLMKEGYKTAFLTPDLASVQKICRQFSNGSLQALVSTEDLLGFVDLNTVQTLVNYSFPSSTEIYCKLLASIARASARGSIHSFCGCSSAPISCKLVDVLRQCSQPVPTALQMLADAAALIINRS